MDVADPKQEVGTETTDTVLEKPVSSKPRTGSHSHPSGPSVAATHAADALHGEETVRARGWAMIVIAMTSSALLFSVWLPGTPMMKGWFITSCAVLLVTASWAWSRTRSEQRYTRGVFRVFGYTAVLAATGITYYVGVFSPVPLIVTLGITFFGLGIDRVHAIALPMVALATYCALTTLILVGVIPDLSLFPADRQPLISRAFVAVNVPLVYLITLWFARLSRRTMVTAIDRSNRAMLLAGQREAQLVEAHQDLDRVLRAGAGAAGRYTGEAAGAYTLAELIGHGAMGDVYAATTADGAGRVAIKVLRAEVAHQAQMIERFLREGVLVSRLEHPRIVRIYGVGQIRSGVPFIAMELLEGQDLAAMLRKGAKPTIAEIIELISQVADGLTALHAAGIIHRDLKPQNLFRSQSSGDHRNWKILDFGVSKLVGASDTLTRDQLVGTPSYMSAEQAHGHVVDACSDLYALGAVAYRAFTGIPPFSGADIPQVLFDVCYVQPKQPTRLVPSLPADLDRALALALAKRPADRPQTAAEVAELFASAVRGTLDPELARRADALIARHPWGKQAIRARIDTTANERE